VIKKGGEKEVVKENGVKKRKRRGERRGKNYIITMVII
jgi:hypothetical protein